MCFAYSTYIQHTYVCMYVCNCNICLLLNFVKSQYVLVCCFSIVPSPPRNLGGGNTGLSSVVLQWSPPLNPSGIILSYTVFISQGMILDQATASSLTFSSSEATQQVFMLTSSMHYTFVVTASNSGFTSSPSNPVTILIPSESCVFCVGVGTMFVYLFDKTNENILLLSSM